MTQPQHLPSMRLLLLPLLLLLLLLLSAAEVTSATAAPATTAAGKAAATTTAAGKAAATTTAAGKAAATTTAAGKAAATTSAGKTAATTSAGKTAAATSAGKTAAATTTAAKAVNTTTGPTAASTTEESNVDASAKAVPEKQCYFPFWFNGGWQHTCKKYNDEGDFWCSLTKNFTVDEDWRRCHTHDLKRFQCHIPFKYKGKLHTKCLPIEQKSSDGAGAHHSFWCGIVPEMKQWSWSSSEWAYCEREDATGTAYLKSVGVGQFPKVVVAHSAANATSSNATALKASGSSSGSSAAAAVGSQAAIGIAVGVVCAVLAIVAVVSAFAIRRRNRHTRGSSLLRSDSSSSASGRDSNSYGGVAPPSP